MEIVGQSPKQEISDNDYINEVKLKKYSGNVFGLNRNGLDMRCPFIPPTIMQRITESPVLSTAQPKVETFEQPKPCNSNCPLFMMSKNGSYHVDINCGNGHIHYKITEIIPFITKKNSMSN